ncbi:glycosyl phosphatidyl inositol protein transamidase complex subunit [Aspergillus viridinutans]|uniref:Glycosyl phosphatidyl inositol protein transamidase complex subunit n=1 Tax=Aspergillus viridinutans TaxID=75553 RepID=A0A9P3C4S8_ASPVI|nr:glycosyl phosphatidyl inositol protein transamidase complex subunit [Aspergillus viridinutans]GIK05867.1 glycosyl phosphatidyl inositol protein transamidase complex subunit [Aspergillus viridinutans]
MAIPAALPPLPFNPTRVRSYVLRLPLFTRLVLLAIVVFWLLELQTIWGVVQWGSLTPSEIGIGSMYRLNTYPFIHVGFFHAFVNLLALTPLLERFEAEHGTLTAVALFLGPLSTFPAGIYILIEKFILHSNTAVVGASVWVFLLLGSEAIKTFKSNPYFSLGTAKIPTWTSPLFACALVSIFMPNTSFLGHLSAIIIGYLLGLGYLKVLVPPEKILRWIEGKLNLLGRLPHYVSVDQKTYGRYGVLPTATAAVGAVIRRLRSNPQFLFVRLPYILSLLCIIAGVVWLLLLPLDEYARRTYISENALLPGQVHAYFSGSEQNIFRGYKRELESLLNSGNQEGQEAKDSELTPVISDQIQSVLRAAGLKVATQKYEYTSSGITHEGQNVYAIIHAPRGDATEAIVLVAAWKTADGELNLNGVSLALTLARYFKRWSLWSKDIIFLFPPDSKSGTQAWIDAYHDMQPPSVQPLPLKSGALQGGLVIEYPFDHRFESLHIVYDGVNGQLPNLDLFNTVISIAGGQMGIGTSLQEMWEHDDSYQKRLQTILRGMVKQGFGHATGAHSSFIPYHIDAITLQTKGDGWQDEMALGRTVESLCRSLNNLLEHLHQSFFFYLLMHTNRFVSIGTYLPSAMLIAGNFTIMAIALWMRTGYYMHALATSTTKGEGPQDKKSPADQATNAETNGELNDSNPKELPSPGSVLERQLALPLTLVIGLHLLGLVPLFIFNNIHHKYYTTATYTCLGAGVILPLIVSALLNHGVSSPPTTQQYFLTKSFSLLLLGLFLSTLATLNFSLSFMVGLLCAPLSFVKRISPQTKAALRYPIAILGLLVLNVLSPPAVLIGACWYSGVTVETVLTQAAFGWNVWGMWTQVVVWCVWWPAWVVGCVLLGSSLL